jgi:formylglycine-generating enzyme required for sulfatase activity
MRERPNHRKLTGYRLPTEAEWEYACKSGSVTMGYYGRGEELMSRYAWFLKNSDMRTWPVGSLRPNDLGLFDQMGNANEMVGDPGLGYFTDRKDDDDFGPPEPIHDLSLRSTRGGSFAYFALSLRSANRIPLRPGDRIYLDGFRVARTLPQLRATD